MFVVPKYSVTTIFLTVYTSCSKVAMPSIDNTQGVEEKKKNKEKK